jgi:hypothetical protein
VSKTTDNIVGYIEKSDERYIKDRKMIVNTLNDVISNQNEFIDRIINTEIFRKKIVANVCEVILPSVIEDVDDRNNIIEDLRDFSISLDDFF